MFDMRRREFITLLSGAMAAAWPIAVRSQQRTNAQTQKVYRIGFLFAGTIALRPQAQEFWRKLQELGYTEGSNLISEIREARGDVDRLPKLASEIVDTHPDVIVAVTSAASAAAEMATQTIPIVMAIVPDPTGLGLVESLARPGTNITGSSSLAIETIPKRVQLIKEMLPELSVLGMLWNAKVASNRSMFQSAEQAARSLGVPLRSFPVHGPEDLQPILNKVSEGHVSALLVAGDVLLYDRRADVIAFSLVSRIPTFHTWPEEAVDGAVAAYGPEIADQYRQAAVYVAKILAGAAPADLPVDQATRFQFVLNLKTAKAIGLKIPDVILLRADKVIE
jgi:putative tryptophan/tyrosine transport system substrate-binding protein